MDRIYYNGKIITMNDYYDKSKKVEMVWVSDGMIKKVGDLDQIPVEEKEMIEWIDLNGKCLMPAFIDPHSHIVMNGQMSLFANLSECVSFEQIINTLAQYKTVHSISEDGIILGYGYDHNFLREKRHPDKYVLDSVSISVPVVIMHVSGHLLCANSKALELCGITEHTKEPSGGNIGRLNGSSEPNGEFEEAGLSLIQPLILQRMHIDMQSVIKNMQNIYIENGITTVQDGASSRENINLLKRLASSGRLKVDVVAYPLLADDGADLIKENENIDNRYENHLKIGGYKIILDGSPQGKTAWLSEPYAGGDNKYCGYPIYSDDTVKDYVAQAVNEERQILVHCNGDAAAEQFLDAYEACTSKAGRSVKCRPVMIHCQTVRNDQLDRMANLNMIASIFVGHIWYWGDVHLENLGEKRGNHISPVKDALERGVLVNFHQDTPVTKPNMLHSTWCAVNRISRTGRVIGQDQKIGVYEALKAVTINAAYEYSEENIKGSIEEGKNADMIILSESPLDVESEQIKNICVLETIKGGKTIFEKH